MVIDYLLKAIKGRMVLEPLNPVKQEFMIGYINPNLNSKIKNKSKWKRKR